MQTKTNKNVKKAAPAETAEDALMKKRKQICSRLYEVCLTPNENFKFETTFVELYSHLDELNKLEAEIGTSCLSTRNEEAFAEFEKFLHQNGFSNEKQLKIDNFHHAGYGVKSNAHIKRGELLFKVPEKIILTLNEARGTEFDRLLKDDRMLSSMPNIALAMFILYLKTAKTGKKATKWRPYLNILPSEFATPLYFTLDELKLMQQSQCFHDILYHIRNIARQYAYLFNLLTNRDGFDDLKANFTFKNYKWCVSVVSTRQNQIVDDEKKAILAMIPFLDMCNHEYGEYCTDYDDENNCAMCFANRDVFPGDQVTIFYGKRTNAEMLIHNGFVSDSNEDDVYKLKLGLSSHDALLNQRSRVLTEFGLNSMETFEIGKSKIFPAKLYFFIKVFITKTENELNTFVEYKPKSIDSIVENKNLLNDDTIKMFLKTRLLLLVKSLEKQAKSNQNGTNDTSSTNNDTNNNHIHSNIQLFLNSEIKLLNSILENLK